MIFPCMKSGLGGARPENGITLVEVMLALGILSCVILPLTGLLATGYSGYRSAIDKTVQTAIVQNIRAFAGGVTNAGQTVGPLYFAEDGTPAMASDTRALYRVENSVIHGALVDDAGTNSLSRTFVDKYAIVHMLSGQTNAQGYIHVTPR